MFLQVGLPPAQREDILYGFTINGFDCSVPIPVREDVLIHRRENIGFDYGAHGSMLMHLAERNLSAHFQYFLFLNNGVSGPFLPPYWPQQIHWTTPVIARITAQVKLVGTSIVCLDPHCMFGPSPCTAPDPCLTVAQKLAELDDTVEAVDVDKICFGPKVEGFFFATDRIGLQLLQKADVFSIHPTKYHAVLFGEYRMTAAIFEAGYTIDSFQAAYQKITWTPETKCNAGKHPSRHEKYFGISMHPFETMFHKMQWENEPYVRKSETELYKKWLLGGEHSE
jgi:hypothetical protein